MAGIQTKVRSASGEMRWAPNRAIPGCIVGKSMKKKVILFFPSYRSIEAAPPLALLALAPIAERRGLTVDIIDSIVDPEYRQRITQQLDETACVGISIVTGPMILEAIEVARA